MTTGCPPPRDVLRVVAAVGDATTQDANLEVDAVVVAAAAETVVAASATTSLDEGVVAGKGETPEGR